MNTLTLKECPICKGALYPHCNPNPRGRFYSHACDLVQCRSCRNIGTLDGRYWPTSGRPSNALRWSQIIATVIALRDDLEGDE